ncbi:MAG: hypothetical protein FK732_03085 [Asgard group archaeon]|nr:hypothetical protein [Asgard group archaeon]
MLIDTEKDVENLKHILTVLEERTLWYKKRQLETKRAMKSIHRLNILPEPLETRTMIEADISYAINLVGIKTLEIKIKQFDEQETSFTKVQVRKEFVKQLFEIHELYSTLQLSEKQSSELFDVVFSLDDDFQRTVLTKFIHKYAKQLITRVFKDIVILDELYTKEVIESLTNYLQKKSS